MGLGSGVSVKGQRSRVKCQGSTVKGQTSRVERQTGDGIPDGGDDEAAGSGADLPQAREREERARVVVVAQHVGLVGQRELVLAVVHHNLRAAECQLCARGCSAFAACSMLAGCPGVVPVSYTHLTLPTICSV
eukprot:1113794-Rhodomonas_salina.1